MDAYLTLQGEGRHTGCVAYFIRLGGCDVGCHWCDVKESWNASQHPQVNISTLCEQAVSSGVKRVVITGGEPLQHNLYALTEHLKRQAFTIHLETSGAYPLSGQWDWVCLSPKKRKAPHPSVQQVAHELKIIIHNQDDFRFAEQQARQVNKNCHLLLQPEWSRRKKMLPLLINYIKTHPQWQLSLQTHKYIGLP